VLVFLVHVVGELFRPVTLALRLFGNITAGETLIFVLVGLSAGLLVKLRVPIPLQLPNMAMEVLIAVVQATVFSLLTAVYLSGVVQQGEGEAE
jgi:F-type H+-transporting ATPase subunit a